MSNDPQPLPDPPPPPSWPPPQQWQGAQGPPGYPPPGQPLAMPGWPNETRSGRDKVFLPGVLLLVLAILNLLFGGAVLFLGVIFLSENPELIALADNEVQRRGLPMSGEEFLRMEGTILLCAGIPELIFALIAILGAICMLMQRGYAMAVIASVLMAIPILSPMACPCLAGIGIGIWCLYTLFLPEVRAAFR